MERDAPLPVPGVHEGLADVGIGALVLDEVEGEGRQLPFAVERQFEIDQGVEEAALGRFESTPAKTVLALVELRNGDGPAAGATEGLGLGRVHQPVADAVSGVVLAAAESPLRLRDTRPEVVRRLERQQFTSRRVVAEGAATGEARWILEEQRLAADATKTAHGADVSTRSPSPGQGGEAARDRLETTTSAGFERSPGLALTTEKPTMQHSRFRFAAPSWRRSSCSRHCPPEPRPRSTSSLGGKGLDSNDWPDGDGQGAGRHHDHLRPRAVAGADRHRAIGSSTSDQAFDLDLSSASASRGRARYRPPGSSTSACARSGAAGEFAPTSAGFRASRRLPGAHPARRRDPRLPGCFRLQPRSG